MRGAIPPFPNKSSWRGAWLTTGANLPLVNYQLLKKASILWT